VVKKTAALFAASAECGALAAGVAPLRVKALRDFGLYFGIAFQMLDDLLDLTASQSELGKPVGNDLRERKMTIPLILALETGNSEVHASLASFYESDREKTQAEVDVLLGLLARAGAWTATRDVIAGYVEQASRSLVPLGSSPARAELAALAGTLLRDSAARAR